MRSEWESHVAVKIRSNDKPQKKAGLENGDGASLSGRIMFRILQRNMAP